MRSSNGRALLCEDASGPLGAAEGLEEGKAPKLLADELEGPVRRSVIARLHSGNPVLSELADCPVGT